MAYFQELRNLIEYVDEAYAQDGDVRFQVIGDQLKKMLVRMDMSVLLSETTMGVPPNGG